MKLPQALTLVIAAAKVSGKYDISWFKVFTPLYVAGIIAGLNPLFEALSAKLEEAQVNLDDSAS